VAGLSSRHLLRGLVLGRFGQLRVQVLQALADKLKTSSES
jgi:hypothetical protein